MDEPIRINWYRTRVDREVMSELMKSSDLRAFAQVIPQWTLFFTTGTLACLAYAEIHAANWIWSVPVLLLALFVHGTFSSFMGMGGSVHELCHKTPFRTKGLNEFFLRAYAFISWTDFVWFRPSHVRHHQSTVHADHDGEVVLPQTLNWRTVKFFFTQLVGDPFWVAGILWGWVRAARGNEADWKTRSEWMNKVIPASNPELRRRHRNWARVVVFGHLALAAIFIATGHWFYILVFNLGTFYCGWFSLLCGAPQHMGMAPNVPDFRLCCRTYTCGWLPSFLYWRMQHHIEHHMYPAVPFYNLPRLRKAIAHDLPPATHGLWATWMEIIVILRKQKEDASYVFVPELPQPAVA